MIDILGQTSKEPARYIRIILVNSSFFGDICLCLLAAGTDTTQLRWVIFLHGGMQEGFIIYIDLIWLFQVHDDPLLFRLYRGWKGRTVAFKRYSEAMQENSACLVKEPLWHWIK